MVTTPFTELPPSLRSRAASDRRRETIDWQPDATFPIPPDGDFFGATFIDAPDIEAIANGLLFKMPEFAGIGDLRVKYVWSRKGGAKNGKATLGKCTKVSGLAQFFGDCDFVVAISADNCRGFQLTNQQMKALVYHELKHIGLDEDEETGDPILSVRPHDVEMFLSELKHYGLWTSDLQAADSAFRQMRLVPGETSQG